MAHRAKLPPSITALRAFDAAARHLSFTAAAVELRQTQGAISHQIRGLEAHLGAALFTRAARGIVLTDAGQTYLPFVREALDRLRAGAAALRSPVTDQVLTVSCSPNFAQKWLVPRLGDFINHHPDIELRISANPQHVSFDDDGIDIAIRHGDGNWPHLAVTRLCEEHVFPVCSPHLLPARRLAVRELSSLVLIHDRDRAAWAAWLDHHRADVAAFELDRGPVFSQTSFAIDAAIAGQGVALARSALAELDVAAGRLARPVREVLSATFAYWIVCPTHYAFRPNVRRFRQWLLAQTTPTAECG